MSNACELCPRMCRVNREQTLGFCGMTNEIFISRAALHMWEEPSISGIRGSGTIFFGGCNLHCVYCQNREISNTANNRRIAGRVLTDNELIDLMLRLQNEGAHNINFVTPTHYSDALCRILPKARQKLKIPVIYNCGGYESVDTLKKLDKLIDVYLPDFKYFSSEIASKYSAASNYCEIASAALCEMVRQTGKIRFNNEGIVTRGVIVRHLVLPSCRTDSANVLKRLSEIVSPDDIKISIMRQYTPDFAPNEIKELKRKLTSFEYDFVMKEAEKYGFDGYFQGKESADSAYTPNFYEKTF